MPKIADEIERLNANIEALVAELREQSPHAEAIDTRPPAAAAEENHDG